jgi:hypothetical protein
MNHYRVKTADGIVRVVYARQHDDAIAETVMCAADMVSEWPCTPREVAEALRVVSVELETT